MQEGRSDVKNPIKNLFSRDAEPGYVPNNEIFAYATGLAGQNMSYGFQTGWWFYFCTTILKMDSVRVGYIQGITRIWDAVNDPLVGTIMDRRRCKSGEKLRPYLKKLPIPIGLVCVLLFVDLHLPEFAAIAVMLAAYLVWDVLYSAQDVALWGMIPLSSPHSHERSRVAQWISIGAGAGGAIAGIFPILDSQNLRDAIGISEKLVIFIGALVFCLGGEIISMSAYRIHELVRTEKPTESFFKSISVLRHNRTLILISLARFLAFLSLSLDWQYFFKSSVSFQIGGMHLDGETSQLLYGMLMGAPGALMMFAAVPFIDKLGGMKRLLLFSESANIITRVITYFIGFSSLPRALVSILIMAIGQIPMSMKDIAHRSLTSDSIDYVEWKTGMRTEGVSFSVQNLISKLGTATSSIIKGYVLRFIKYDASRDLRQQGATFNKAQWPLFILGPIVGSILYIIVISFVKDDKEQKAFIEQELRARRGDLTENAAAENETEIE